MSEEHSNTPAESAAKAVPNVASQAAQSSHPGGRTPPESSAAKGEVGKSGTASTAAAGAEGGTKAADSLLSEIANMASKGAQQGRSDAEEVAEKALPAIKLGLQKASYSTGYYVSFSLVLTGKLLVDMLPSSSALRHGIDDGSLAAQKAFALRKDKPTPVSPAATAVA